MKYSAKGPPPPAFLNWLALANPDWTPTYARFSGAPRIVTHDALLIEQRYVCCYCGRSLRLNGTDSHFDHFRPQSKYNADNLPDLTLSYENFVLSCGPPSLPLARHLPSTCGDAKNQWFDEFKYIAPWDPTCEARFAYGAAGGVTATDPADDAAMTMVKVLHLDHPALAYERSVLIADLEMRIAAGEISQNNVDLEISVWRTPSSGILIGFGHVAARYLGSSSAER